MYANGPPNGKFGLDPSEVLDAVPPEDQVSDFNTLSTNNPSIYVSTSHLSTFGVYHVSSLYLRVQNPIQNFQLRGKMVTKFSSLNNRSKTKVEEARELPLAPLQAPLANLFARPNTTHPTPSSTCLLDAFFRSLELQHVLFIPHS